MQNTVKHITRILLIFYSVYAFSPLYAASSGADNAASARNDSSASITVGILWLGIVFDAMLDDVREEPTASYQAGVADDDLVFVKKKRTITRKRIAAKPVLQIEMLARNTETGQKFTDHDYDTPCDLIHGRFDGYYSLCTGLSPPIPLA